MKITRSNVYKEIDSILNESNIRFNLRDKDARGGNYELFVGSMPCFIQIETSDETSDDETVSFQFYTDIDKQGIALYHTYPKSDDKNFDLEDEINSLIEKTKKLNTVISKIEKKIEQIKEICEEYQLEVENFIEITFDFNK